MVVQTLCRHCVDTVQILCRHWADTVQTLGGHCADTVRTLGRQWVTDLVNIVLLGVRLLAQV
jgi:hypothetical protein